MFINRCCQLINLSNCIREQGLKQIGHKRWKELTGVVGIQGKKVRKYLNLQRPGARSLNCVRGYLTHKRRNLVIFRPTFEGRTGDTHPISTAQDKAVSGTNTNLAIPTAPLQRVQAKWGNLRALLPHGSSQETVT